MKKVIVSEFISLDGVIEDPKWTFPYWNDEIAKFKYEELFAVDSLLLGRVTYQGFAAAWPGRTDEQGYADRMNGIPKFVVSTTLDKAEWHNSSVIKSNVAAEVTKLKEQPGQDILIFGSGALAHTLRQADLVDEYRLLTYPIILGGGKRLFSDGNNLALRHLEVLTFSSGAVLLRYQRER